MLKDGLEGLVQQLKCECGGSKCIVRGEYVRAENGVVLTFENMPLLKCRECGAEELPSALEKYAIEVTDNARAEGYGSAKWTCSFDTPAPEHPVKAKIDFSLDWLDHYILPGLTRPWNDDGFLTPVFFDIKCLDKYSSDDAYRLEIVSETMGSIYGADGFMITFGLNRNDRAVMWLGDLTELSENEQYYLRSFNIESDHNIASDFYDAQILAQFTEPSAEKRLLMAHNDLNDMAHDRLGMDVLRVDAEAFVNARQVHRPTSFTRSQLCKNIAALNKLLVEAVNPATVKTALKAKDPTTDLAGLKGNKSLEALLACEYGAVAASDAIKGFFILYDWRITCEHALGDDSLAEMLCSCAERLGVELHDIDDKDSLREMYDALLTSLLVACEKMTATLASLEAQGPA